ncbi:PREDICTED: pentatricopeptide repeat-containing protein At5g61800 [Tarenaya hassleriana]|uniref:pentatricopeptide repeat-containing protein At5g61800 n=1 Tax=Tarenaya hassleriana TaxID=28532 RepID=UPI00053C748D|nr:PREDICTED: pentatricopeptide repeat-containing protein At5g61800 [Tarenaya hassleriana]
MVIHNRLNLKPSVENLLKLCKTLKQLHQSHAQIITSGQISHDLNPNFPVLTKILFAITSISPSLNLTVSSPGLVMRYATWVFRFITNPSTFCFNTIIRIHSLHGSPLSALCFFAQMRRSSVPPDFHTFPFAFKVCAQNGSRALAETLHCQALRFGLMSDLFTLNSLIRAYSSVRQMSDAVKVFDISPHRDVVTYNVLIDGLVKAREVVRARELFDSMPFRDLVSWNSLISGYAQMNRFREAIQLFNAMIASGLEPDNVAIVSVLSACAQSGSLEKGMAIHDYIRNNRIFVDSFLATALVDFYAKCGFIDIAMGIFSSSSDKTLFTWNAMITGLAMHGSGELTLDYFFKMVSSGIKPDAVSFLGVLVGCSHGCLVDDAKKLFNEMESVYGVARELKHYGCMADVLGRAGLIEEATELIKEMPNNGGTREKVYVWSGLLGGCRIHGNIEVAEKAAERVKALKPEDGGVYKVMAEMYANAERWEDVIRVRESMDEDKKVKKNTGCSLVVLDRFVC